MRDAGAADPGGGARAPGPWRVLADTGLALVAGVGVLLFLVALLTLALRLGGAGRHARPEVVAFLAAPGGLALSLLAPQAGFLLVLHLRVARPGRLRWPALLAAPRASPRALCAGLGVGLAAFLAGQICLQALSRAGLDPGGQTRAFSFLRGASPSALLAFGMASCVSAPVAEELFFRAYALRVLSRAWGGPLGLLGSSALFAGSHWALNPGVGWGIVPLLAVGLVLGAGYARAGGLGVCVLGHGIQNLLGLALLLSGAAG